MIKKILFCKDNKFYWEKGDLHSQYGAVKEDDVKKAKSGNVIKSNTGKDFLVIDASIIDNLEKIKRGPAVMIAKDIGWLLVNTGIDKDSIVAEAGSGSGMLAINLARFCKKVYSYEKNADFFKIVNDNIEKLEIKNIVINNKDISEIEEKNLDAIFLDMLDPWNVVNNVGKAIKPSGYLAGYVTNTGQLNELVSALDKNGFMMVKAAEVIEREWHVEEKRTRPVSSIIGHTGFLVIARKV